MVDAKNGEEALKLLNEYKDFDLVITDIKMNNIDGFQLIDEMDKMGYNIPVVIESAYIDSNPDMLKYKERVEAFIKKPIDLNLLESVVRQIEDKYN